MRIVTLEEADFRLLVKKIDKVLQELRKLQDPVEQLSRQWCTTKEAAQVLKCSTRTIASLKRNGVLIATTIKTKDFYDINDLKRYLDNNRGLTINKQVF
jgi:hypothetical protein